MLLRRVLPIPEMEDERLQRMATGIVFPLAVALRSLLMYPLHSEKFDWDHVYEGSDLTPIYLGAIAAVGAVASLGFLFCVGWPAYVHACDDDDVLASSGQVWSAFNSPRGGGGGMKSKLKGIMAVGGALSDRTSGGAEKEAAALVNDVENGGGGSRNEYPLLSDLRDLRSGAEADLDSLAESLLRDLIPHAANDALDPPKEEYIPDLPPKYTKPFGMVWPPEAVDEAKAEHTAARNAFTKRGSQRVRVAAA